MNVKPGINYVERIANIMEIKIVSSQGSQESCEEWDCMTGQFSCN